MRRLSALLDRVSEPEDPLFDQALFVLALGLRLVFLGYWLVKGLAAVYGRDIYFDLAKHWAGLETLTEALKWHMTDATHPPLYTALIAAVLYIFRSPEPGPVLLLQALLSSLSPLLVLRLGRRLLSERAARLAALWTALDPGLIYFAPQLGTETLFVFMELGFFVWLYRWLDSRRENAGELGWVALLGALASLCRSVFAAYPVFLGLALLRTRGWRKTILPFALFSVGWLSPIGVWTYRNWVKYDEIIPIGSQMGYNLWEGFTLDREEVRRRPAAMGEEMDQLGLHDPMAAARASRHFLDKTVSFARERPLEAAKIVLGKALLYWRPWPYDPHSLPQRAFLTVYFCFLFVLAGAGIRSLRKEWLEWLPIYALFVYLTAMHAVFFTSLRYRIPLEPFLCLLAAAGLEALTARGAFERRGSTRSRRYA